MSSNGTQNPDTPLAFLAPNVANQLEVARYIYVASLGAFAWDLFSNLPSDIKLLLEHRINMSTVAYFVSRTMALAYISACTVFQIGSVGSCQHLEIALGICFAIAIPATSLLFLVRVHAIFRGEKTVVMMFNILWLSVLGGCITVPFAISGIHIGPTNHCVNTGVKSFASVGLIVSAVNDTCVMVAITLRILHNASIDDNLHSRIKAFWNGGSLPRFSKSILQSGQQYYLITVVWNIVTMVMILSPSIPAIYRGMFTVPNVLVENSMACKVYRDIRLGHMQDLTLTSSAERASLTNRLKAAPRRFGHRTSHANNVFTEDRDPEHIAITKTVEHTSDMIPMEVSLDPKSSSRTSSTYDRKADVDFGSDNV